MTTPSRALVTGGAGFVGANLIGKLVGWGYRVCALVRPGTDMWRLNEIAEEVELIQADLRDAEQADAAARRARADHVFHLAARGAYSWQTDQSEITDTNLTGTMNLLDSCARAGFSAFVNAGSSSEYGFKDHAPAEEEWLDPNSHYAVAKAAATHHCRLVARTEDLHVVTLRLYSAYGAWEDPSRLLPRLVALGLRGELPPLVDPGVARDFVYVDDVCEAFRDAAQTNSARGSVYNIGSGRQTTIGELVDIARTVLPIAVEPRWDSLPSRSWDTGTWVADPSRAERELGWRATTDLASGIRLLAAWMEHDDVRSEAYGVGA